MHNVEDLEIDLLLEGVFRRFGHDFRGYQRTPVRDRVHRVMRDLGVRTVSALLDRVMHDPEGGQTLLRALSIRPAALFDDADYFRALREVMVPWVRSFPAAKIWVAECVSAEEVGALSILLEEECLHDRTQIFATASNEILLQEASEGCFDLKRMPEYAKNYRDSGGKADLDRYCSKRNDKAVLSPELLSNIIWAQYSLVTDASFNEFQLIMCRRALSDFGVPLRRRTLQLFYDSMPLFGILSVDRNNGLDTAPFISRYKVISEGQGLYRRVV